MSGGQATNPEVQAGRGRLHRRSVALALLLSFCAGGVTWQGGVRPSFAQAADSESERAARGRFRQGEVEYAAGRYAPALTEYQAGYDVLPLPGFLVNIAQCQRRLGDLARARATYQTFIMVAPDSPLVPEVSKLVAELDRLMAETAAADRAAEAASSAPIAAVPVVALTSPSQPSHAGVNLIAPADAPPAAPSPGRRWWLWGVVAAVVAGGVVAAVALSAPDAQTIHDGSLGTLRR